MSVFWVEVPVKMAVLPALHLTGRITHRNKWDCLSYPQLFLLVAEERFRKQEKEKFQYVWKW